MVISISFLLTMHFEEGLAGVSHNSGPRLMEQLLLEHSSHSFYLLCHHPIHKENKKHNPPVCPNGRELEIFLLVHVQYG